MAIDDWSALLLLLAMHKVAELIAVTSNGAGETRCGPAIKNIAALLDLTPTGEVQIACKAFELFIQTLNAQTTTTERFYKSCAEVSGSRL